MKLKTAHDAAITKNNVNMPALSIFDLAQFSRFVINVIAFYYCNNCYQYITLRVGFMLSPYWQYCLSKE
ncbi:hypothetical protein DUQ00_15310 [Salmonella bongori]|uniref:Uncharacterized protein n=3 Tax=Salmonella bongori TaxID=54736 RepID=A0A248KE25_SALBN|nr:hypothetical protein LFZ56_19880 [Salmonella bongori serovar 66:z41:- str. SA19983605]ECC8734353.1 hypothetical protein [Salmonella bongori]HAC6696159.1 hypothetical protein [Salmonella bongori serovar 44:r:-]ECC8923774.1 hypothetical protein [Salmonella bongori]ECC9597649.1 hypothetical protein [Salmonella bongori]